MYTEKNLNNSIVTNRRNVDISKVILMMCLFSFATLVFVLCPSTLVVKYKSCYYILCINLFIILMIWEVILARLDIDVFDPFLLATIIHVLLFEITPLICLWTNDISWFDVNVWDGCIKGTWISTAGFVAVALAYFSTFGRTREVHYVGAETIEEIDEGRRERIYYLNLGIWIFAFISSVLLQITSGKNILYMLTLQSTALSDDTELTKSAFQFLGTFGYMMLPSFLYVAHFGKSKVMKVIMFYLMAMCYLAQGFRFIIVAIIVAPLIMYFLNRNKRPKGYQLLLTFIVLALMVGFVGYIRTGIRTGGGVISTGFGMEDIVESITGNFEIFKTYYGIINHMPSDLGYTLGQQMFLYTLILFIPRSIWPGKPQPILRQVNTVAVSEYANTAGTAYPYIGEYYQEFGIIGVIILSFVLGKLLKKMGSYMYKPDIHSIVMYSAIYPLILQVLIRGYTPSNFYLVLFVIVPIIFTRYVAKAK